MDDYILHFDPGYMGTFTPYLLPLLEFQEPGDIILISHAHQDHLKPDILKSICKPESLILAPKKCIESIKQPFTQTIPGAILYHDEIKIEVVHAYNTPLGHSTKKTHLRTEGVGYLVTWNSITFYHAGDTDLIPEMKQFPSIDIAFLPIGGTYTMDINEAVDCTLIISPEVVIPMHFLDANPNNFKMLIEKKSTTKAFVFQPGESQFLTF